MPKTIRTKAGKKIVDSNLLAATGVDGCIDLLDEADIEALLALEHACFDPRFYNSLLTLRTLQHFIGPANGLILLYKTAGRVAGYAQVTFKKNLSAGRFYSLAVHPDFQGTGVASRLFSGVEKLCVALGAPTVLLEIREDNHVLKKRYEKLGYRVYRTVPDYYADHAPALKMRKTF